MLDQRPRNTRSNMVLWIAVVLISTIGLGANVYKANTDAEIEWPSTIAEIACLLTAVLFIVDYIRQKHKEQENDNK